MSKKSNRLSAPLLRALTKPGRYADGGGLYLHIRPTGSRTWVFRYRDRVTAKLRDKGFGSAETVTLAEARLAADEARRALAQGADPIDARREQKASQALERARAVTFGECCRRYIEAHSPAWRNAKHRAQWQSTLSTHCAALLPLPVSEIDKGLVLSALQTIWTSKTETATRVRQRIEAVLDWAEQAGLRTGSNPARWKGGLDKLLPAPAMLKNVEHLAALPYTEIGTFIAELRQRRGLAPIALELQILTATRSGEVIGARWEEIDLKAAVWSVPAARMKAHREHRIPLSPRAVDLLFGLPRFGDYVFPGLRPSRSMTTASLLKLTRDLRPGLTAHGARSTFRDWCADCTAYPRETAEAALAHVLKDKTEAAYRRSDLFEKRRRLMNEWARYCEQNKAVGAGNVTPIGTQHAAGS